MLKPAHISVAALLAALVGAGATARADADLGPRRTHVSREEAFRDELRDVREQAWLGDAGIVAAAERWSVDSGAWVARVRAVYDGLTAGPGESVDSVRARATLQWRDVTLELERLTTASNKLAERCHFAVARLDALRSGAEDHLLYPAQMHALEAAAAGLRADLLALRVEVLARAGELARISDPMHQKINAKLEHLLKEAHLPDWEQRLAALRAQLAADDLLDPRVRAVASEAQEVKRLAATLRVFAARTRLGALTARCAQSAQEIAALPLAQPFIDQALADVASECSTARDRVKVLDATPQARRATVYEFAQRQAFKVRKRCSEGDLAANCALAAWLVRLPKGRIVAMADDELAQLEAAWVKAERTHEEGSLP